MGGSGYSREALESLAMRPPAVYLPCGLLLKLHVTRCASVANAVRQGWQRHWEKFGKDSTAPHGLKEIESQGTRIYRSGYTPLSGFGLKKRLLDGVTWRHLSPAMAKISRISS